MVALQPYLAAQVRSRNKVRDDKCCNTKRHVIAHHVARSKVLYFLYPSQKFLSSHNSLRNFFSPSRGESKIFRLTKLKISTIFLNKPNFLNRKRLCFFASKSALLDFPLSSSLPRREFQHLRFFTNRSE